MKPRTIYVISDLHLGGDPTAPVPGGRGFRICQQGEALAGFIAAIAAKSPDSHRSELVIAGDFVDFLAETPAGRPEQWAAFQRDPKLAREIFETIAGHREPAVFDALARLVGAGHRLTILLGNHDLELSLPDVRQALLERIGAGRGRLVDVQLVYDNEAYVIEDLLIEHGNQADAINRVDFGQLRRIRSRQSRRTDDPALQAFDPPHGSRIVAELMNDVKQELPFIDLLKPETRAAFLILVALKPSAMRRLPRLVRHLTAAAATGARDAVSPGRTTEIARLAPGARAAGNDPLLDWARAVVPEEEAAALTNALGLEHARDRTSEVASVGAGELWRALQLLRRFFDEKGMFDADAEVERPFLSAAEAHARAGFRCIVFGHTHLALESKLQVGHEATYLNTGTWADVMRVPKALRDALSRGDEAASRAELRTFLEAMRAGDLKPYILARPTFARIELEESDRVRDAQLCVYRGGDPALSPRLHVVESDA